VVVALAMLAPFALMIINAFKSPTEYSTSGPLALPSELYTKGLVDFWNRVDFPTKLWNSIWTSAAVALFGTLLSLLSAYALGVGRVRGRLWLVGVFLLANMLPQEVLLYPLYDMAQEVGLNNSGWSIVIIFTVIQSAFGTYLVASVLGTFPPSLLEAAALDGANSWQQLWKVVFPIVRPTLSVLMIFFFIWTWNEFFIPLVMLTSPDSQTVPITLSSLQGDRMLDVPTLNAGALVSLIPTLIFFLIFQRTLTRGVTAGSIK
jgi:raffinose/stachyose/melibiose transport system permease protein